jgi:hypothetical protein
MKSYEGIRTEDGIVEVTVDGRPLDPRFDLRRHSPTGFEFGYGGSGPSQLALAILADALGDDEQAQQHYQRFKREKISRLEESPWVITQEEVRRWIDRLLKAPERE